MKVIESESIVFCDVDETLILHIAPPYEQDIELVRVQDTLNPLATIEVRVNEPMIRLLREEAHRGSLVVVWSKGGYEWATNVIKALKLENIVDYVMSKPNVYFDDKPIEEWLKYRVFISPETVYKNKTINTKETK